MSRIVFYLFLKPISLLPYRGIYALSDLLCFVLYNILGYRKKVVVTNLKNSFPDKSPQEIEAIAHKFYHHFCDLILESVKMFSITKEEINEHCQIVNPEVFEHYAKEGRSLLLVAGHYNNWELAAVACDLQTPHTAVGIYSPLANPYFDKKLHTSRSKFGMELLPKKEVKAFFKANTHRLNNYMFGADQSPSNAANAYWTTFLHQDTAVAYGTEKYAVEYNYPVVFGRINKLRRGYYTMDFTVLEDQPAGTSFGEISEKHTRALEQQILAQPEYWLWTHKRWKRKRPAAAENPTPRV
ncbi:MAG: lipid A biosynthesis acyltransferase [Saprospiraceae bacterium]|nr:lipid A biosynthesis acyltransferase [Saprospiraceae bacterium]